MSRKQIRHFRVLAALVATLVAGIVSPVAAQSLPVSTPPAVNAPESFRGETTEDYNRRLEQLRQLLGGTGAAADYRIGPEDLIEISVFDAPDLNRTARVDARGEVSLPLLDAVLAAGLTPQELERVLEDRLRQRYMKEPHVSVFVREMESHPVSVMGAVNKPGVFKIRGTKTVLEMLSMAQGLTDEAGDTVLVMRGASYPEVVLQSEAGETAAAGNASRATQHKSATERTDPPEKDLTPLAKAGFETVKVNLKDLLNSGDPRYNVPVYPGDVVKVTLAGIVYVVGEVHKPGGFVLKNNEKISVLQAIALAEGLTRTSARSQSKIIRIDEASGTRSEIPIDLSRVLSGRLADPMLRPKDIVFVPNSGARSALYRGSEAAISILSGFVVYRR